MQSFYYNTDSSRVSNYQICIVSVKSIVLKGLYAYFNTLFMLTVEVRYSGSNTLKRGPEVYPELNINTQFKDPRD